VILASQDRWIRYEEIVLVFNSRLETVIILVARGADPRACFHRS
jgi:hypothetical protein